MPHKMADKAKKLRGLRYIILLRHLTYVLSSCREINLEYMLIFAYIWLDMSVRRERCEPVLAP